jgi:hypothetical protein
MAIAVPTRLWLGGVQSPTRDKGLIGALFALVHLCALPLPLLVVVDGFRAYIDVIQKTFRQAVKLHRLGRPRLVVWASLVIGQVVKQHKKRRLVAIVRRLIQGTTQQLAGITRTRVPAASQTAGVLNTSLVERLNATFRASL